MAPTQALGAAPVQFTQNERAEREIVQVARILQSFVYREDSTHFPELLGQTVTGDDGIVDDVPASRLEAFILGRVEDERRHRRIVISLPVRFMVSDESEHRGLLFDMSPGGVSVTTDIRPKLGSRTVLYIEDLGRVEGEVARHHTYGFAIRLTTTQHRRDKIAERLIFHANRHRLRDEDLREHERVEADHAAHCTLPDGTEVPCRVVDLSLTGAGVEISPQPAIGSEVVIGRMRGKVVRHVNQGIAVRFLRAGTSQDMMRSQLTSR